MMRAVTSLKAVVALVILCSLAGLADASVVVSGTRVIYPAEARDVSVALSNTAIRPHWCKCGST